MRCFLLVLTGISAQFQSFSAIYQAETAVLCKAITETKNSGYIGDAYVNFDNEPVSYLENKIGMAVAGAHLIHKKGLP